MPVVDAYIKLRDTVGESLQAHYNLAYSLMMLWHRGVDLDTITHPEQIICHFQNKK